MIEYNSFEQFFGLHIFSGCKLDKTTLDNGEEVDTCLFCLDNETYELRENPCDGYRSYCEDIRISDKKLSQNLRLK